MTRLLAALTLTSLTACYPVFGNGKEVTEERTVAQFSRLEVHSGIELVATTGAQTRLAVTTDENLLREVETFVTGDTLVVRVRPGTVISWPTAISIAVTSPRYEGLRASGAATVDMPATPISGELAIEASGASTVRVTSIAAAAVRLDASGASHVRLAGTAVNLTAIASGASEIITSDLPVDRASLDISGASFAKVKGVTAVSGHASGASTVEVVAGAGASVFVTATGASTVRQVPN